MSFFFAKFLPSWPSSHEILTAHAKFTDFHIFRVSEFCVSVSQVISESKSELRLANTKRIAFKKELHDRMPKILRVAALAALKVLRAETFE